MSLDEQDVAVGILASAVGFIGQQVARHGAGIGPIASFTLASAVPTGVALAARSKGSGAAALVGSTLGAGFGSLLDALSPGKTSFLFWSDSHGARSVHEAVVRRMMLEQGVDFVVFGGDAEDWSSWDRVVAPLRDKWPVYAVRGNHDALGEFKARFGEDKLRVLRVGGGYLVLMPLNANRAVAERAVKQIPWFAVGREPVVVVLHYSPIPFSSQNAGGTVRVRDALEPLLGPNTTVLCGHHHVAGWGSLAKGTNVLTAGIAGSKRYTCVASPQVKWCDHSMRGYLRVELGARTAASFVPVSVEA